MSFPGYLLSFVEDKVPCWPGSFRLAVHNSSWKASALLTDSSPHPTRSLQPKFFTFSFLPPGSLSYFFTAGLHGREVWPTSYTLTEDAQSYESLMCMQS